jgi:hypothetical protein
MDNDEFDQTLCDRRPLLEEATPPSAGSEFGIKAGHMREYSRLIAPRRLQTFLEFARQFDESRGQTDVLVHRIAVIVPRYNLRPALVGHGRGNFIEARLQQIADDVLDRLPGKQLGQRVQAGSVVQTQANRVLPRGARRSRALSPTIEQGLEFHDISAINRL